VIRILIVIVALLTLPACDFFKKDKQGATEGRTEGKTEVRTEGKTEGKTETEN